MTSWRTSDRLARAKTEREAARRSLANLIAILRSQGGYLAPEHQEQLREAERTLEALWSTGS